jgi:hypothetical protein
MIHAVTADHWRTEIPDPGAIDDPVREICELCGYVVEFQSARAIYHEHVAKAVESEECDGEAVGNAIGDAIAEQVDLAYAAMRLHDITQHVSVFLDEQTASFMHNLEISMHSRGQCIHWLTCADRAKRC